MTPQPKPIPKVLLNFRVAPEEQAALALAAGRLTAKRGRRASQTDIVRRFLQWLQARLDDTPELDDAYSPAPFTVEDL